jgi:hypothetical protein
LVANGHDVDRLDVAMHEPFAVKVGEDVQDGIEHLSGFARRERPAGKNLRKVFLGTLHHDVQQLLAANLAASPAKK